jgi:hypothetical protein
LGEGLCGTGVKNAQIAQGSRESLRVIGASVKPVLSCKLKGAYLGMIR